MIFLIHFKDVVSAAGENPEVEGAIGSRSVGKTMSNVLMVYILHKLSRTADTLYRIYLTCRNVNLLISLSDIIPVPVTWEVSLM